MCGILLVKSKEYIQPYKHLCALEVLQGRGPDFSRYRYVNNIFIAQTVLHITGTDTYYKRPNDDFLAYNGEIYNHLDIRALLLAQADVSEWKGHSDTETLLVAICHWGLEVTLKKLNGMFAFSLWDNHSKNLYLARDRIGEKPMYYGTSKAAFLFGSQLKSLSVHPCWQGNIDRDALSLYMKYGYVPAPYSIYDGIRKLPPAHFVVVSDGGNSVSEPKCYWTVDSNSEPTQSYDYNSIQSVTDNLESLLLDSVRRRMDADVPIISGQYVPVMAFARGRNTPSRNPKNKSRI